MESAIIDSNAGQGHHRDTSTMLLGRGHEKRAYFMDRADKVVYLTGSHTWNNFQEISDPAQPDFDFNAYLTLLKKENHNFIRLWVWEQAAWAPWTTEKVEFGPLPYVRSGPGMALDGKPRFDLTRFHQEYFDRLRSRVIAARDKGIYVSVMLFQGWSVGKKLGVPGNSWPGHPFNRSNNINNIDGDLDGTGEGREIQTLANPAIVALQERYVRKVVDTLNDLDNVLWEICNESDSDSKEWQYHMIDYVKRYEAGKSKQHVVGMTAMWPKGQNVDLVKSPADWISPVLDKEDPHAADGRKVVIADTDHIWGVGGNRRWVWKCFLRGLNPVFMDPFDDPRWKSSRSNFESYRRAMGHTLAYANRMNLADMSPRSDLASSAYCLANVGEAYLVYVLPVRTLLRQSRAQVTVSLLGTSGTFLVEWFNPLTGQVTNRDPVEGGSRHAFSAPFRGEALMYIRKR
ncbi:MAG TPA: DUF6298 domain-containing protein [Candidatus Udaeobacter sp.]|jgi:hypothetical protein